MQPVLRPTLLLILGAQAIGGVVGLGFAFTESPVMSAWIGAAALTLPAFMVGIAWQAARERDALRQHWKGVLFSGAICLLLSLAAAALLAKEPTSTFYSGADPTLSALRNSSVQIRDAAGLRDADACRFSRVKPKDRAAYRCDVPETSRDAIRSALVSQGWEPMTIPPNMLLAYRRNGQVASFACLWQAGHCELWLSTQR